MPFGIAPHEVGCRGRSGRDGRKMHLGQKKSPTDKTAGDWGFISFYVAIHVMETHHLFLAFCY